MRCSARSSGSPRPAFIRGLSFAEDIFERISNPYLRNVIGMLLIGVLIYVLLRTAGHYYVEGVGYSTIQAILSAISRCRRCCCCCLPPSLSQPR